MALLAPSNIDIPIWRYVDLAKFVSMLRVPTTSFCACRHPGRRIRRLDIEADNGLSTQVHGRA
jgi:hypothetical protein